MMISSGTKCGHVTERFIQCSMNMIHDAGSRFYISDPMLMEVCMEKDFILYFECVMFAKYRDHSICSSFCRDVQYHSFAINGVTQSKRFSIVSFDVMPN